VTVAMLVEGVDRRFAAWSAVWTVAALLGFGLVSAIIPNPLFARQIPAEPFAIAFELQKPRLDLDQRRDGCALLHAGKRQAGLRRAVELIANGAGRFAPPLACRL
jgi:hypothetical protein